MTLTTIIVTKIQVNQTMLGQYSVIWGVKGFDESEIELFSGIFSEDYKTGDSPTRVITGFTEQMQACIDKYKNEQSILNHVQMDTAVTDVQTALII